MPRGGVRSYQPGRPRGSKDRFPRRSQKVLIMAQIEDHLRTNNIAVFEGDSLDLAISIYKNENLPIQLRLHALSVAIPYEHPRLAMVASVSKRIEDDDGAFGRLFAAIEQKLALAPPEQRGEVIEMLRSEEDGECQ
jgi:hypothetical protein